MKYRAFLLIICFYISGYKLIAQYSNQGLPTCYTPNLSLFPDQFGKAGVSEDLSNGTLNISIPLHELQSNHLSTQVACTYSTGGIKVSDMAGRIGLCWNLVAGGEIRREVKGLNDDNTDLTLEGWLNPNDGTLTQGQNVNGYQNQPLNPAIQDVFYNQIDNQEYVLWNCFERRCDGEPDIYHFNFNGYSGKIIFGTDHTPYLVSKQNIKIDVQYSDDYYYKITRWKLTTGDGVKYYFGTTEYMNYRSHAVRNYKPYNYYGHYPMVTAWYLDSIVSPSDADRIVFGYTQTDSLFFQSTSQVTYQPYAFYDNPGYTPDSAGLSGPAPNCKKRMIRPITIF